MSLTIEIASENLKDNFQNTLFRLRDTYQQCSAYTNSSMSYRKQTDEDNGIDSNNKSFIVRLDGEPVVPLENIIYKESSSLRASNTISLGLHNLEKFVSINGANHYNLKTNKDKILMSKSSEKLNFKEFLYFEKQKVKIFKPEFPIFWYVAN